MESETRPGSVVIVGIGQMASVLGFGFLRLGRPVVPVTREMSMRAVAEAFDSPELVLIAVGEDDLEGVLSETPSAWRDHLALLQNELRPSIWARHHLETPTVLSAWFEKKKGMDVRTLRNSPVFGPKAELVCSALLAVGVASEVAPDDGLVHELAKKNLYILTVNIAGLVIDRSVGELWNLHHEVVDSVFAELYRLEERLLGVTLDRSAQEQSLRDAVHAAPERRARGRTAHERLLRTLRQASDVGLSLSRLSEIAREL